MPLKIFVRLHFILALALIILSGTLLTITQPSALAAGKEHPPDIDDLLAPNARPKLIASQQITKPMYSTATLLLEDQGGVITDLLPASANWELRAFYILKEGDTYNLWLTSGYRNGATINSITQRFESQDGLVWRNRTNTNLAMYSTSWKWLGGPRHVIKDGPLYEAWEDYFYEWVSGGWAVAIRYITSTNGLTWTVVNQPALQTGAYPSMLKEGNTYHMWAGPDVDVAYDPDKRVRYRTSSNGGSGWGHWKNDGIIISVDNSPLEWYPWPAPTRVRRVADGTYQLFYLGASGVNLATSTEGITFTTQITNLINFSVVLSTSFSMGDFLMVDVQGEDWFYFTYGDTVGFHIAVAQPIHQAELALTKSVTSTTVHPGDFITYTLTFSNTGKDPATGVVITDILPSALMAPSVTSNMLFTDTGYSPGYVWQVQNLPPGTIGVITITSQINSVLSSGVSFTNVATIATTTAETDITNNFMAVSNIIADSNNPSAWQYLPIILSNWPSIGFPLHIANAIPRRPVAYPGEIFFTQAVQIPAQLPTGGHFYFSTQPNTLTNVLVDDGLAILLNGVEVFAYDFSSSGSPQAAILEVPRATMEQIAGQTVTIQYRDIYSVVVEASNMWLIWVP